jgi:hypothetical protein
MLNPKDAVQQYAIPVNPETGRPLTELQVKRLQLVNEAIEPLLEAMHTVDGSTHNEHEEHLFTSRNMKKAADYLEIAMLLARRACLEA